jgi:hypothetical protein
MIERHQDYVLRNITVPANGSVNYVVALDSDAPFALRCVLSSGMPTSGGLTQFQFIILGMDDRRYMGGNGNPANGLDSMVNPGSLPFIIYPQITFASHITIQVTVIDVSGDGITNGVLVFRGTKIYPPGTQFGPAYPQPFSELNFRYVYPLVIPLGSAGTPSLLLSQPLNIQSDADFVARMCSAGNTVGDGYDAPNTWAILRDQYGKPYSNDWVPIELLFPQTNEPYPTIYPEIYLKKSTQLLLDLMRTSGTQNDTIQIVLHGSKIFQAQG